MQDDIKLAMARLAAGHPYWQGFKPTANAEPIDLYTREQLERAVLADREGRQQWIDVRDRLPEPDEPVLVHNGRWTGVGAWMSGEYLEPIERWQDEHREFIEMIGPPVTHWQPLPASPADAQRANSIPEPTPDRYVALKASGSSYTYVNDTQEGKTVKRYPILKGDGWDKAEKHAAALNAHDRAQRAKEE